MDDLYPRLAHAIFDPWLSSTQFDFMTSHLMGLNDAPGAKGSAYDGGWEGYLQRALSQALGSAAHPYSQSYCGNGSLSACQDVVIAAIQGTIDDETRAYGVDNPDLWTCSRLNTGSGQCNPRNDDVVFSPVGVLKVPDMEWINRPTFQQVVQYQAHR